MPTIKEFTTDFNEFKMQVIADKDLTSESSALTTKAYIVGDSATGLWAGQDGNIAYYDQSEWKFITPENGYLVVVDDENSIYIYHDSGWRLASGNPVVTLTTGKTLNARDHANRPIVLSAAAGQAIVLPAATGTGNKYPFVVGTTITSNSSTIKVANATDIFTGRVILAQDSADTVVEFDAGASDDTVTMNGSTTGGLKGDRIEITDIASGLFHVEIVASATGTEATPFSATVS